MHWRIEYTDFAHNGKCFTLWFCIERRSIHSIWGTACDCIWAYPWVTCKTNCIAAWLGIRDLLRRTVCRYIHIMHTCVADAATCFHSRHVYIRYQLWCYVCTPGKFYSLFLEMLFGSVLVDETGESDCEWFLWNSAGTSQKVQWWCSEVALNCIAGSKFSTL